MECDQGTAAAKTPINIETYCLTLPGRELHLPSLLLAKSFEIGEIKMGHWQHFVNLRVKASAL